MSKTKITLLAIGGVLLLMALAAATWAWRYYTAEVRGKVGAEERIESAPSRIANYEHFFDLCSSVQRKESKIKAQKSALEHADGDDESRIRQNIAALKGARAGDIHRYNADASKQYTRARFLASNLPSRLDVDAESTTCAR